MLRNVLDGCLCVCVCVRLSDSIDYISDDATELILYPEDPRVCFNVTIVDDDIYEQDERFSVILDSSMDEGEVTVTLMSANITIRDNDGK